MHKYKQGHQGGEGGEGKGGGANYESWVVRRKAENSVILNSSCYPC